MICFEKTEKQTLIEDLTFNFECESVWCITHSEGGPELSESDT